MSSATDLDWKALTRLVRYLAGKPRAVYTPRIFQAKVSARQWQFDNPDIQQGIDKTKDDKQDNRQPDVEQQILRKNIKHQ